MSRRGQNNGTVWFDCPFCGKHTARTNLMGDTDRPNGFPYLPHYMLTPHTAKCFMEKNKLNHQSKQ